MRKIYSIWVLTIFVLTFFILFPFYYVFLQNEKWHRQAHKLTKIWAWVIMKSAFLSIEVIFEEKLDPKKKYIYAPNHFSYFDIPMMCRTTPGFYKFIGKKSLGDIPIFGYMFKRLYITVDRQSKKDSYRALTRALEELNKGAGLVVYPEGGIKQTAPRLAPFKEGPFRMSVESGTELVPVTIPYNWIFLPDDDWVFRPRKLKITYHKVLKPEKKDQDEINRLKEKTYQIISEQLKKDLEIENR